jgi:cell division protein FtsB
MRIGRYLFLIILFVGFFIVFGNRGLLDNMRLKEKLSDLRSENSRIEVVNGSLKREAVLLQEDPRYIETVARDELGMVKRGDIIYRHVDPSAKKDESAASPAPNDDTQTSQEPAEGKRPQEKAHRPAKQRKAPI